MNLRPVTMLSFVWLPWICLPVGSAAAAITLPAIFSDHMVLQRGMDVPVWGTASANEKVTVECAGKSATATADGQGQWSVKLPTLSSDDVTTMTINAGGPDAVVIKDVLIGDVWICSGQSNMEMQVKNCNNAEKEVASATDEKIRVLRVPHVTAVEPTKELKDCKWIVCSPRTAGEFTAVGYFFGREIREKEKVAVGLIDNSWGGMPAESFTSKEMLESDPDFKPLLNRKADAMKIGKEARDQAAAAAREWDEKWIRKDEGNEGEKNGWAKSDADESDWKSMDLPRHWEDDGLKIDGAVWFRKTVDLPENFKGQDLVLTLGGIDDYDVAYVNGKQVGHTEGPWAIFVSRTYPVPAELTKGGKVTIAVRVFDRNGQGGIFGPTASMQLLLANSDRQHPIALAGPWKYKVEKAFDQPAQVPPRPAQPTSPDASSLASNIYNAMINPIIPFAIKGAIWYQGESNADRAVQYRKLFPAMIKDWRDRWGQRDFPFYFVQLANFGNWKQQPTEPAPSQWAELREAQTMTLKASPNTGMAVIIDIGDTRDIHPKNKQDVGKRLALWAEKFTYGNDVEYVGPMYESSSVDGDKIRIKFSHANGLTSRGGPPKAFAIAGDDQKFQWADAKIEGDEMIVSCKDVPKPVAVRYAWADDPPVNTDNFEGLPMCPFRTDDWKLTTADAK